MATSVRASNIAAFFAATEGTPGTAASIAATDAIRVANFKAAPRGATIIARQDVLTPLGGGQKPKTGSLGWDITFDTELYLADPATLNANPLAKLFRATPFLIDETPAAEVTMSLQSRFTYSATRTSGYECQSCTILWQELDGKQYQANGCVGFPKFVGAYGERIMINWTFKALWVTPVDSTNLVAEYSAAQSVPVINVSNVLTLPLTVSDITALTKWTFDPGYTVGDVGDAQAANGFAIGLVTLTNYPTLEVEIADLPETDQSDFADAVANTSGAASLVVSDGTRKITFSLAGATLLAMPEPSDVDGHRALSEKWGGVGSVTGGTITYPGVIALGNA